MAPAQVWFITGASSGFGLSMAKLALARGDVVVATARKPELLTDLSAKHADKLVVIQLDVTSDEQIASAFAQGKSAFGRIDIVYNNAGQGVLGEVESMPEVMARNLFEVNFWGVVNVSKEAVRFFREENPSGVGGILLQSSSILGVEACACVPYYSASKWALEGFSEALAREIDPKWNIKIVILEAGWFRTNMTTRFVATPSHAAYTDPSSPAMLTRASIEHLELQDPDKANRAIFEFVQNIDTNDTLVRLPIGKDSVAATRRRIAMLSEIVEKYEKWSEDVVFDKS
ncbi:NAD(P)-binding protein [Leucogyrophana mollusca]|uniref:NAD(P)-binding protein n=1 Tax=Leucogyrophana mollusca TaxID=85980 RepID=A0ACB8BC79_9AGAM|nr:NAD(P)-binding protein [Leucogyrophana mollusca]